MTKRYTKNEMANDSILVKTVFRSLLLLCTLKGRTDAFLDAKKFMFAACDNTVVVSVDGSPAPGLPQYTIWPTLYAVDVPPMAKVIALSVSARDKGMTMMSDPSAIIGFVANTSVVSDSSWKCTSSMTMTAPPTGWMLPTFDDTSWSQAPNGYSYMQQTSTKSCNLNSCTECDPKAKWIGYYNAMVWYPTKFYCRLHLPSEEASTTINKVTFGYSTTNVPKSIHQEQESNQFPFPAPTIINQVTFGDSTTINQVTFGDSATIVPNSIHQEQESNQFVFRIVEIDTKIPSLGGCIRRVRSRISCARICTQRKEFCEGFQHGGPDESCCPMNADVMQYGVRQTAVGFNIWRLVK